MSDNRMVFHDGQVIEIPGDKVRVKIISQSACSTCHAKNICNASEMQEKIIDAIPVGHLEVGDEVVIKMGKKMGWKAVFYGFFLPLLVILAVLIGVNAAGGSEIESALYGLGALLPYYLVLYVFRRKIEKDFVFNAEKKNKN